MLSKKRKALINLKNIPGWRTNRKIVVISVDDYGNIRMASKQAKANLEKVGLEIHKNHFDQFDCLEDKKDLEHLFDTLSSVKDKHGNSPVFTAFTLPVNLDFQKIIDSNYSEYHFELLPGTLNSLPGYEGTWDLWKEGISNKLLYPQSHGREHFNVSNFLDHLKNKNEEVIACIQNRSYAGLTQPDISIMSYERAFAFYKFEENDQLIKIAQDGLIQFEKVFGFKAQHFTAPGIYAHHSLEEALAEGGIKYIDSLIKKSEHQGRGKYKNRYQTLGKRNKVGQRYILRNCVFEPFLNPGNDAINECLAEISIAFRWNKPANISTHRVNFCGHIDPKNREVGLKQLKILLNEIMKKWPDVEFMTTVELGELMDASN
ncbi:MAG: hypothetical protein AB8H03_23995 [Saprospiraceae bacterium]